MSLNIHSEFKLIAKTLDQHQIPYALCGGLAVAVHGYPRATIDIDLLIRESDLESIVHVLRALGYTLSSGIIPLDVGKQSESRIYRTSKTSGEEHLTIDLMFVTPILEDVWSTREELSLGDVRIHVVSLQGLRKMKELAGRPQDVADLENLKGIDD